MVESIATRYEQLLKTARTYAEEAERDKGAPTSTFGIMVGHFNDYLPEIATLSAEVSRLTQEVERLRSGRVEKLEWREEEPRWFADHACGAELIVFDDRASRETAYGWFNAGTWEWFATLDAAKAAAQADFERRILSTLSPEPSPGEPTLASIYADLAARQEPLGLDLGNYEDLYERDEPSEPAEPGEGHAKPTDHASTSPGPVNCSIRKRHQGEDTPRTCERCTLGPCPFFHEDGSAKR